jgi:hypothetical protein
MSEQLALDLLAQMVQKLQERMDEMELRMADLEMISDGEDGEPTHYLDGTLIQN